MNANEPTLPEESLFLQALEIDSPDERVAFLDRACAADTALRNGVEALLRHHREGTSFLESSPTEVVVAAEQLTAGEAEGPALDFLSPSTDAHSLGRLGYYEVVEVLGQGGFGVVLKARDTKLDRIVAVKTLSQSLATSATARKRFVREAKAAAAVKHENVVGIYHVSDEGPVPYLVMECVSGVSLETKLKQVGTLDLPAILRIGMQVASGLAAAHQQGLVHRDVKPGNILLENGVERVKITDFGLARAADDVAITRTGEVAGTPPYMSPEQAQGLPLDARSDLFSLGSVLYAMCTGRSPFRAESTVAVLRRVCDDTPRPIREINGDIPDWLADIIDRLLAKQPSERFQTATEVADLLGLHLAAVQQSVIVPSPKPAIVSKRRPSAIGARWWSMALISLLAVACAIGLTEASGVTQVVPTVIRIVRGEGTLVIELDDPTVQVSLDGEELSIRGAGLQELKLTAGKYRLHATKDGQPVKDELVTVSRDGRKVVTVTLESPGGSGSSSVAPTVEPSAGELTLLAKLEGHTDLVRCVAFLPDGRRFVSVGRDKMVRIWDVTTRSIVSTLPVEGYLRDADVSADGRYVAVAFSANGKDAVVHVWDLEKRARIAQLVKTDYRIDHIRIAPNATHVLTGGHPSGGVLWDLESEQEVRRLDVDIASPTLALEYSTDGQTLAIGTVGGVRLFNTETGIALGDAQLPHPRGVLALGFAPDGKSLACGQMGGHLSIVDVQRGKVATTLPSAGVDAHVHNVRFLDDRRLMVTCHDGTVQLWDLQQLKLVATAATETGTAKQLSVSPDRRYAITAEGEVFDAQTRSYRPNGDYALRLWQLPESVWSKQPTLSRSGNENPAPAAMAGPEELALLGKFDGHTDVVRSVTFLTDAQRMVSVGRDRMVRTWDVASRTVLDTLPIEGYPANVDVSADGQLVAVSSNSGDKRGVVQIWDLQKRERRCELAHDFNFTTRTILSPDGTRVLTIGRPNVGILWDLATGKELRRFEIGETSLANAAAFSPDGRLLALGATGRVRLFDPERSEMILDISLPSNRLVQDAVFTTDSENLAIAQNDGEISLVDVNSGRVTATLQNSNAPISRMRFLGKDRLLLATSHDGALRIWDVERKHIVATAMTEPGTNDHVSVSPDGRHVVAAGGEVWDGVANKGIANGNYSLRHWQLPESVWPKGSPSPSSSAETANQTPKVETGAFVRLGGNGAEQPKFETLAEAVQGAYDGDTIELRGNGPFAIQPINLGKKGLTIRAAAGFRPVIKGNIDPTAERGSYLLSSQGPLVLEGLELHVTGPVHSTAVSSELRSLNLANCRFVLSGSQALSVAAPGCTVRNCEFVTVADGFLIYLQLTNHGKMRLENNLFSNPFGHVLGLAWGPPDLDDVAIHLKHNTVATRRIAIAHGLSIVPTSAELGAVPDRQPVQMEVSANLFDFSDPTYRIFSILPELYGKDAKPLSAKEMEGLLPRLMAWREERNLYCNGLSFQSIRRAKDDPSRPKLGFLDEPLPGCQTLADWQRLWNTGDSGSLQGDIRYEGGNVLAKMEATPELITAEDFRLRADSPGYRAGKDGKDLGADVDLVGPGLAYERWRKMPEYQEWLKESGQTEK